MKASCKLGKVKTLGQFDGETVLLLYVRTKDVELIQKLSPGRITIAREREKRQPMCWGW